MYLQSTAGPIVSALNSVSYYNFIQGTMFNQQLSQCSFLLGKEKQFLFCFVRTSQIILENVHA